MKYLNYTFSIILFAFFIGCSSNESKPGVQQNQEQQNQERQNVEAPSDEMGNTTQSVHLYGIDKMKFVVEEKSDAIQTSSSVTENGKTYYVVDGINTNA